WDCRQAVFATPELDAPIATLAFAPKGELLATGCKDGTCRVFAVPSEQNAPLFAPLRHFPSSWGREFGSTPVPPLFLDEGRVLLTAYLGEASWCDPRTGKLLRVLRLDEPGEVWGMNAIALSGDGKHMAMARSFNDRH